MANAHEPNLIDKGGLYNSGTYYFKVMINGHYHVKHLKSGNRSSAKAIIKLQADELSEKYLSGQKSYKLKAKANHMFYDGWMRLNSEAEAQDNKKIIEIYNLYVFSSPDSNKDHYKDAAKVLKL